jgi:putative endonuclease
VWYVYLLECRGGSVYTGITTDVARRFEDHRTRAARYTGYNPPVRILGSWPFSSRSAALKREAEIKRWPRRRKLALAGIILVQGEAKKRKIRLGIHRDSEEE